MPLFKHPRANAERAERWRERARRVGLPETAGEWSVVSAERKARDAAKAAEKARQMPPLVVREYRGRSRFEKDAQFLTAQGYRITHQSESQDTSGMLGFITSTRKITVTYER